MQKVGIHVKQKVKMASAKGTLTGVISTAGRGITIDKNLEVSDPEHIEVLLAPTVVAGNEGASTTSRAKAPGRRASTSARKPKKFTAVVEE